MTDQQGFATLACKTDKGVKTIGTIIGIDTDSDSLKLRVRIPKKVIRRIFINAGIYKAKPRRRHA